MLHTWFICAVRYDKTLENGMQKKVTEPYLVDAMSFTEAEARIIEEIKPFISGEFEIANIKKAKINEMFFDESGDKWFKCKVNFVTIDEKSGAEKKTGSNMLVQATDLENALKTLIKGMGGTLADYEIASISETTIMDVYPWTGQENEKENIEIINFDGKEIEASISSIEMLGAFLKAKKIVAGFRNINPEKFEEFKELIKSVSKDKKNKFLHSAITLAKDSHSTNGDVIWILGTAAIILEESNSKEGGNDVIE